MVSVSVILILLLFLTIIQNQTMATEYNFIEVVLDEFTIIPLREMGGMICTITIMGTTQIVRDTTGIVTHTIQAEASSLSIGEIKNLFSISPDNFSLSRTSNSSAVVSECLLDFYIPTEDRSTNKFKPVISLCSLTSPSNHRQPWTQVGSRSGAVVGTRPAAVAA